MKWLNSNFIRWLLIMVFPHASAYAVVVGELQVLSKRNEAFVANLPITSSFPKKLSIKIADNSVYEKHGVIREDFLDNIQFNLMQEHNNSYVKISSIDPIFHDFFTLIFNVSADGKQDEYSALIDFDDTAKVSLLFDTKATVENVIAANSEKQEEQTIVTTDSQEEQIQTVVKTAVYPEENKDVDLQENIIRINDEAEDIYQSDLYQQLLQESQKVSQNNIEDLPKYASLDSKNNQVVNDAYEVDGNSRLKMLNDAINWSRTAEVEEVDAPQNVASNSSILPTLTNKKVVHNSSADLQVPTPNNIFPWSLVIGLLTFTLGSFYLRRRQRKSLKEIYFGNFDNIDRETGGNPRSSDFHSSLKNLLKNGNFEEAVKMFKYEFRYRGMNLYELCRYYETFYKYGITEFATDTFLQEVSTREFENNELDTNEAEAKEDTIYDESENHEASLHKTSIDEETNKDSHRTKSRKEQSSRGKQVANLELEGVADNDVITAKLNLASAYLNMGDYANAASILNYICQHGNPQQRREASRLLKRISH